MPNNNPDCRGCGRRKVCKCPPFNASCKHGTRWVKGAYKTPPCEKCAFEAGVFQAACVAQVMASKCLGTIECTDGRHANICILTAYGAHTVYEELLAGLAEE